MTTFTGEEFVKALHSAGGIPQPPVPLKLTGLVKQLAADVTDAFLFSPGSSCAIWIPVPIRLVEKIYHLGKANCGDHQHELVRVHFKSVAHPEAAVFAQLLQAQSQPVEAVPEKAGMDAGEDFEAMDMAPMMAAMPRWGWKPPWTWSQCAKCKLEVNLFITGSVMAAIYAAGGSPPSMIAAAKLVLAAKCGAAAAEAAASLIVSGHIDAASKIICKSIGKC